MSDSISSTNAAVPILPVGSSAGAAPPASAAAPRPTVMQLVIKESGALQQAYIPMFATGGIFVPTTGDYRIGDDLYVLLTLPDDRRRHPVAGKVAWITPARASGNRTQGVGLCFLDDDKARQLRVKIEQMIGSQLNSERPTQTI